MTRAEGWIVGRVWERVGLRGALLLLRRAAVGVGDDVAGLAEGEAKEGPLSTEEKRRFNIELGKVQVV